MAPVVRRHLPAARRRRPGERKWVPAVALVVNEDLEKGETWTGAVEQLERLHFVPMFLRNGAAMPKGNAALQRRGAQPWPNPQSGGELITAMTAVARDSMSPAPSRYLPTGYLGGSPGGGL